jgi:crotonobetainyl-CoA:carnitine CoA-transferase CaiB-like acyl-CoA transferase
MIVRLMKAHGAPENVTNQDYATSPDRQKNRDKLNAEIDRLMANRTSAEWVHIINEAGVPCGPIYSIDQTFADPQVKSLGIVQDVPAPKLKDGVLHVVGQPIKMTRTPSKATARPPERGEHNEEVLSEFGFSGAEIAAMKKDNVI